MPTPCRSAVLPLLLALAAASCSSGVEPTGCRSDDTCPGTSRCQAGICVAGARPIASIRTPGPVEEFALVHLDGTASHDPDGAGEIVDHLWSVRAVTARCEPPSIAGRTPVVPVRFGCPGGYEVSLAVRDALGLESDPATIAVDVVPAVHPSAVLAGADLVVDHLCAGDPLLCRPAAAIALSASSSAGASLRWSVEPPVDRALDATRRVAFVPGPDVPAPAVTIETDGTAISGDWIFRVEARDAYGVVGAAHTRVSVSNRPPVVVALVPADVPHAFDAARSAFVAAGEIGYAVSDPDGDPVAVAGVLRHVGDGGAAFTGELLEDRLTFAIEVPYGLPEDALHLIGGPGLERAIEIVAVDVNRVAARATVPVTVGNRPPAPVGAPAAVRAPHRFDAAASRYQAVAELGAWEDPDGDPLSAAPGAAPCGAVSVVEGIARVECAVAYEGTPAVARIAGRHAVTVRVRDPWVEGPAPVQVVEVLNSPPAMAVAVEPPTVASIPYWSLGGGFAIGSLRECRTGEPVKVPAISFVATPAVSDPDGDPVAVSPAPLFGYGVIASPAGALCTETSCVSFAFAQPRLSEVCPGDPPASRLVASDGAATIEVGAGPKILF